MPTTVTHTLKASGGDYTTITAWEAAQQRDLVSVDEVAVLECYNDWPSGLSDSSVIDGWTTDATRFAKITSPVGERHDGTGRPNSGVGFFLSKDYNGAILNLVAEYTILEYAALENIKTTLAGTRGLQLDGAGVKAISCVIEGHKNDSVRASDNKLDMKLLNCLIFAGGAANGISLVDDVTARSCTVVGLSGHTGTGILSATPSNPEHLSNCVVYNCGTSYASTGINGADIENNAASDGSTVTPPGTNPLTVDIVASDFIDAANDNYHLSPDSQLIGQGVDLSAEFTTDVDGDTRDTPWDIGFDARGSIQFGKVTVESGGTTTTVALDFSAAVSGQALIAIIGKDDDVATSGPAGWTLVQGFESNNAIYIEVWKKEATGSETSTETWTGDSEEYVAAGYLIDNADYASIGVGVATSIGTDAAPVSPTVTPLTDDALVLAGFVVDGDSTPVSVDSGLTDSVSLQSTTGAGSVGMAVGYLRQATAAATGTFTHSLNSADEWAGFTIWIEKAAGAAGAALAGDAVGQAAATGALTTDIPLAGASLSVATANGAISTSIPLDGLAAAVSLATGALSAQIKLDGAAIGQALANAGLTTDILLAAASAAQATATGDLTAGGGAAELAGDAAGVATADGDLDTGIDLSGDAAGQADAVGDLSTSVDMAAGASGVALATGDLTIQITLAGDAVSQALATGALTAPGSGLSGDAAAEAGSSGLLTTQIPLAGSATAVATGSGNLSTILQLSGAAAAASNAAGGLTTSITLNGAALAQAFAGGDLTTVAGGASLAGDALVQALAGGSLATQIPLDGDAVGVAVAAGNLTTGAIDIPTIPRWMATAGKRNWTVEDKRSWEVCA